MAEQMWRNSEVVAYAKANGLTYNQAYYRLKQKDDSRNWNAKREYYQKNRTRLVAKAAANRRARREHYNFVLRQRKARHKSRLIELLGGCCKRCGFADERALQVDHVNGRKGIEAPRGGDHLYAAILSGKVAISLFQLLCANCNQIKRFEQGEGCFARGVVISAGGQA